MRKVLLLGHRGKMGTALMDAFADGNICIGRSSADFDAADFDAVRTLVRDVRPDVLINAVAYLGIDPCEQAPERAIRVNALYPQLLAELALELPFRLIHFSTDAVFSGSKGRAYVESDPAAPINTYGLTKYGGDCFIAAVAPQYYIFRLSVLFGRTQKKDQFVEKMLHLARSGRKEIRVSQDIVLSPSYAPDLAREVRRAVEEGWQDGLYHLANAGEASLFDLMNALASGLHLAATICPASYREFPHVGRKNTFTPLASEKRAPLRDWREAVYDYCRVLQKDN